MHHSTSNLLSIAALAAALTITGCAAPSFQAGASPSSVRAQPAMAMPVIDDRPRGPTSDDTWWRVGALAVVVPVALTVFVAGGLD